MSNSHEELQFIPHADLPWREVTEVKKDRVVLSCGHELLRHYRVPMDAFRVRQAVGCHDCTLEGRRE